MYKVIRYFTDLQDNGHAYNVGDTFPRDGMAVSADRIAELSSTANKQGVCLIEEVRGVEKAAPVDGEPKKRKTKKSEE